MVTGGVVAAFSLTCGSVELGKELQGLPVLALQPACCGRREFEACGPQSIYCAIVAAIVVRLYIVCSPSYVYIASQ